MASIDRIEKIGGRIEEIIPHSHLLAVEFPNKH